MLVLGTEMHLATFIFLLLETLMFFHQFIHYLQRPQDKRRKWYLILLFFLIVYNITGGLFPDSNIPISIVTQNIIAYGSGFAMGAYFPYYFYKAFELTKIRFHAIYGVLCFLLLPYFVFFVIDYGMVGDLDSAVKYGVIVPFFYSFVVLTAIVRAIRYKYKNNPNDENFWEMIAVYCAVLPWATLTPFAYFGVGQFWEVIFTNGGFTIITILFITRNVRDARKEYLYLQNLHKSIEQIFDENCAKYQLSNREVEVARLVRSGMRYKDIAEELFISEKTVGNHIQRIFEKMKVTSKTEMVHRLTTIQK